MKESYSDFSIVKNYIELKAKYETEVRSFSENTRDNEEKFKKHVAALESEIVKRNEHIKALDAKIQEMSQKLAEKDEQMKSLGLQLHKLKLAQAGSGQGASDADDLSKKGKFGIFK